MVRQFSKVYHLLAGDSNLCCLAVTAPTQIDCELLVANYCHLTVCPASPAKLVDL